MSVASLHRDLVQTLERAAAELADLGALARELEFTSAAVGRLSDHSLVARCQLADALAQRLTGIGAFLHALAKLVPADVTIDLHRALSGVNMSDQARRLSGMPPLPDAAADEVVGSVVFFDG